MIAGLLQRRINDLPANSFSLGFNSGPEPATISNRGVWKIGLVSNFLESRRRAFFRPGESRVYFLTIESLKCCDSHTRVHEKFVSLYRSDDNRFRLGQYVRNRRNNETGKKYRSENHRLVMGRKFANIALCSETQTEQTGCILVIDFAQNVFRQTNSINAPTTLRRLWSGSIVKVFVLGLEKSVVDFIQLPTKDLLRS